MKRYKLLKDLPTFKAGDEFFISKSGDLIAGTPEEPKTVRVREITPIEVNLMAYSKETLEQFPNILTDWFEEVNENRRIYYANDFGCSVANMTEDNNSIIRKSLKSVGNYFKTYEEAEKYLEYLKAKTIIKQDTKGFKPNWNDTDEDKYHGFLSSTNGSLAYMSHCIARNQAIYFKSAEDIEESFNKHPKEWETYLTYEQ